MELLEVINELVVKDINKTIEFYEKYLNFEIIDTDGNPISWAKMKKDECFIMFENYEEVCKEIKNYPNKTETSNIIKFKYANEQILMNLYNKLCDDNIHLFMELKKTEYGSIEFGVFDPDKNMIILSC